MFYFNDPNTDTSSAFTKSLVQKIDHGNLINCSCNLHSWLEWKLFYSSIWSNFLSTYTREADACMHIFMCTVPRLHILSAFKMFLPISMESSTVQKVNHSMHTCITLCNWLAKFWHFTYGIQWDVPWQSPMLWRSCSVGALDQCTPLLKGDRTIHITSPVRVVKHTAMNLVSDRDVSNDAPQQVRRPFMLAECHPNCQPLHSLHEATQTQVLPL